MLSNLRKWFLAGVIVTLPVAVTVYLVWLVVHNADLLVGALMPAEWQIIRQIPGIGVVSALVILIVIGMIVSNYFGRVLVRWWDYVVHRLPVVSGVYGAIKQVLQAVFSEQGSSFKEVVYVEFPQPGQWMLGFVIDDAVEWDAKKLVRVFIPQVPVPTSGFMVLLPPASTRHSGMTVEEGLKLTVTMGLVGAGVPDA